MKWIAYCIECNKDLTEGGWANGGMVEAQAALHIRENGSHDHTVIVGFPKKNGVTE